MHTLGAICKFDNGRVCYAALSWKTKAPGIKLGEVLDSSLKNTILAGRQALPRS